MNAGDVLVGDGGMTFCLEKRGYVKAGPWSPECTVESPEAGEQTKLAFAMHLLQGPIARGGGGGGGWRRRGTPHNVQNEEAPLERGPPFSGSRSV